MSSNPIGSYSSSTDAAAPFTPALVEAIANSFNATSLGAVGDEQTGYYSVIRGAGGARVLGQAESDASVAGFKGAMRRLHPTLKAAVDHVDGFNLGTVPRILLDLEDQHTNFGSQLTASLKRRGICASERPVALPGQEAIPKYSVNFSKIRLGGDLFMPSTASLNVGGYRIDIRFEFDAPRPELARDTADPSLRGDADSVVVIEDESFTEMVPYLSAFDIKVMVDDSGKPIRVVPKSTLAVNVLMDWPALSVPQLCMPAVPAVAKRETGWYYWAVIQGRRVGIFYATVDMMESVLPPRLCVCKATLTPEEAVAYFEEALSAGFVLTEINQAPRVQDVVLEAIKAEEQAQARGEPSKLSPSDLAAFRDAVSVGKGSA